ncbi:hypothetical protein HAX54_034163 [Datura stramonium]|uniref:Uncharacterized protein n=1 Tax=Datura stramonium TaxID=4076 RepID=A0ABS8VGM6_DATST|nr:hypothetical protein [Datura stramonium]
MPIKSSLANRVRKPRTQSMSEIPETITILASASLMSLSIKFLMVSTTSGIKWDASEIDFLCKKGMPVVVDAGLIHKDEGLVKKFVFDEVMKKGAVFIEELHEGDNL